VNCRTALLSQNRSCAHDINSGSLLTMSKHVFIFLLDESFILLMRERLLYVRNRRIKDCN
jgi:hypothetical protein